MSYNEGAAKGLDGREADIYRDHCFGMTQMAIAEKYGISQPRVSQILKEAKSRVVLPDLADIRHQAMTRHLDTMRRALELADMNGAPVTAGKDGTVVYDPADGSVVRDYAGRVAALKLALDADKELRKLMGADAATKTEVSGGVRYEVVGVDVTEDLT